MALSKPNLEFTSRDFDTNVLALVEAARRALPGQWTSFQDGDFGQALLELIAYDTSILSFVQDQQAKERFLLTVEQYESAILFASQQGYRVRWGSPATIDVWAEQQGGGIAQTTFIREGAKVTQSNGLLWEVVGNYEIQPGRRTPSRSVVSWGQIAVGNDPAYIRLTPGSSQAILVDASGNRLPDSVSFDGRGVGPGHFLTLTGTLDGDSIDAAPRASLREYAIVAVGSYQTDLSNGGVLFLDRPWAGEAVFIGSFAIESRSISLVQGETHEEVIQLSGADREGQVITCTFPGLSSLVLEPVTPAGASLQTSDSVAVAVNGQLWRETPSLSLEGPEARVYETFVDGEQKLNLRFGDGVHGVVLQDNSSVAIRYRTSNGVSGNIKRGSLSASIDSTSIQLTNPYNVGTGGRERESLEELKAALLTANRSNDRAVTAGDFESLASGFRSRRYGSIAAVQVERVSGIARNNVVKISTWARSGTGQLIAPSVGIMAELRSYLTERAMVTDEVIVVSGKTRTLPVVVRYKFFGVGTQDAYNGVRSAINDVFRRQTPGAEFHLGDLYDAVESLPYIAYCSFFHPSTSVPAISGAHVNSLIPHSSTRLVSSVDRGAWDLTVEYPSYFQPHSTVMVAALNKLVGVSTVESISGGVIRTQFDTPIVDSFDTDSAVVLNSDYWAEGWSTDLGVSLFVRLETGSNEAETNELVKRTLQDWFRWFVLPGKTLLKSDISKVIGRVPNVLGVDVRIGNPTSVTEYVMASLDEKPVLSSLTFI